MAEITGGNAGKKKPHVRSRAPKDNSFKQKRSRLRQMAEREFPIPDWIILIFGSILVTLIVESLSRRSVSHAFQFITQNPLAFILNCSLVAFFMALAMMFKRRVFALALAGGIWIILALINYTVMSRRGRLALYAADLHNIAEGIIVIPKLFDWWQVVLIAAVAVLAVAGLVVLLLRTHKYRRDIDKSAFRLVSMAFIFTLMLLLCLENGYVSRKLRPDFYAAYKKNGFSYSFVYSIFDTGMVEPEGYTDQAVKDIQVESEPEARQSETVAISGNLDTENGTNAQRLGIITEDASIEGYSERSLEEIETKAIIVNADEDLPNIIVLQLEAFCEPSKLGDYEFEGQPIPTFTYLSENFTYGTLGVPTVAGGTCNTEFEVLTGCNLDLFGANEYPYYNLVKYNEFESLANALKPYGYTSTFLHDYTGTFYGRNVVCSNLGFDKFASLEYMYGYTETEKGWAKDIILKRYIMESLNSTEGRDLVMAVGVQTHSAYPELSDEDAPFIVTKAPDDNEADRLSFQYYLMELCEVDSFLKELTDELSAYDEKVMLVIYGDHLPGIRFNHDEMTTEELFSTSYVIWTNYELEKNDKDLEAYQLGAYALKQAGIYNAGAMVTVHQRYMDSYQYMDVMTTVQYDITYGEHFWYNGNKIERQEPMEFGVEPIEIERWYNDSQNNLLIYGANFTTSSEIYINSSAVNTIFVGENLLISQGEAVIEDDVLEIRFYGEDGTPLSSFTVPNDKRV